MQISSRFTVALHIFACVEYFGDKCKVTSDFLAASINTNPVIIRRILGQLSKAGLIKVIIVTGGIEITRPVKDITFLDVYKAVDPLEDGNLFHFHDNPNPDCPVGRNIHSILDGKLHSIQEAMEDRMKEYTLEDIRNGINEIISGNRKGY